MKTYFLDYDKALTVYANDLTTITNIAAVVEAVVNLLSIETGEIPNSEFGVSLRRFFFTPVNHANAYDLFTEIQSSIDYFLPEIGEYEIAVNFNNDKYEIEIYINVVNVNGSIRITKSLDELRR